MCSTLTKLLRCSLFSLASSLVLVFALAPCRGAEPVWVAGVTEPIKDLTLAFPVLGVINARHFEEGAAVTRGQVIVELEKRLEELEAERKQLERNQAKAELDRLKSLAQRNTISVSREELEKKQAEYDIARVDHEVAVELVRRRVIVSPIDGYVTQFYKDVGEKCDEQEPVLRLVDTRRCYFVTNLEAKSGSALKLQQRVQLALDTATNALPIAGAISYISPVVDPASGLLRVKAVFDNADGAIRPGIGGRMLLP